MEKVKGVRKDTRLPDEELGDLMRTVMFMIKRIDAPEGHPGKLDRKKVKARLQEIIFETGRVVDWSRKYHDTYILQFSNPEQHISILRGSKSIGKLLIQEKAMIDEAQPGVSAVRAHELLCSKHIGQLKFPLMIKTITLTPRDIDLTPPNVRMTEVIKRAADYGLEPLLPKEAPQALLSRFDSDAELHVWGLIAAMKPVSVSQAHSSLFSIHQNGKADYKWASGVGFDARKYQYVLHAPTRPGEAGDFVVQRDAPLLFKKRDLHSDVK